MRTPAFNSPSVATVTATSPDTTTNRQAFSPERTPSPERILTTNRTVFPPLPVRSEDEPHVSYLSYEEAHKIDALGSGKGRDLFEYTAAGVLCESLSSYSSVSISSHDSYDWRGVKQRHRTFAVSTVVELNLHRHSLDARQCSLRSPLAVSPHLSERYLSREMEAIHCMKFLHGLLRIIITSRRVYLS